MKYAGLEHDIRSTDRTMSKDGEPIPMDSLLENLSIGIVMVNGEGVVIYLNAQAEQILQVSRDEVTGTRVYMLPLRTPIYKVLSENCRDYPIEMSLQGRVVQARATSVHCHKEGILGDMFELRDITKERQERRRSDEFVAAMTHDLKSPLTVIFGYIDVLKNDLADRGGERAMTCLEEMSRGGNRLLGMIEDILDSYRLDMGHLHVQRDSCDLKELLEVCCGEFAQDAQAHGLEFSYAVDPNIPVCQVDGKQMMRVFANLIGNAIKFTPQAGSVRVDALLAGDEVRVSVIDTGIGISAHDQQRIFTKYFRSREARGYKGSGLGLTISKAITEEHGGIIEVASNERQGSRFTVRLPVNQAP